MNTPLPPERFSDAVAAFAATDRRKPPPPAPVLLVGSSTFTKWTTAADDLAPLPVLNRGFGGSRIPDVLFHFDRVVAPYRPSRIVFYCGDNDIAAGYRPAEVAAAFSAFAARVRAESPAPISYLTIKHSPARWAMRPLIRETDALIADVCRSGGLDLLDIAPALLGADDRPLPGVYEADDLHLNAAGYRILARLLRSHLSGCAGR